MHSLWIIQWNSTRRDHPRNPRRVSGSGPVIPSRQFEIEGEAFMIAPQDDEEPKTITEDLSGPKTKEWSKAMAEEMESMRTNQVWDLVDLPP